MAAFCGCVALASTADLTPYNRRIGNKHTGCTHAAARSPVASRLFESGKLVRCAASPQQATNRGQVGRLGYKAAGVALCVARWVARVWRSRRSASRRQASVTAVASAADADADAGAAAAPGPRVAFVIGGPGSGKGTQCERVVQDFGYTHLSAGDLLRAERAREGSKLGEEIENTIREGKVVPSDIIATLLEKAMHKAGWNSAKFVIDGYPRSAEQLEGWEAVLGKKVRFQFCISLDVEQDEMLERLRGRAETSGRLDDNEDAFVKRFKTFEEETGPVLSRFDKADLLRRVNGGRDVDAVWKDVRELFEAAEDEVFEECSADEEDPLRAFLLNA